MILKPFVLVLSGYDFSQQLPVARAFLDYCVVFIVAEVWHSAQVLDLFLDVLELFEAKCVC